MSDKNINIELSNSILILGFIIFIILFTGQPDLWDVIMYNLSDGRVPIPSK